MKTKNKKVEDVKEKEDHKLNEGDWCYAGTMLAQITEIDEDKYTLDTGLGSIGVSIADKHLLLPLDLISKVISDHLNQIKRALGGAPGSKLLAVSTINDYLDNVACNLYNAKADRDYDILMAEVTNFATEVSVKLAEIYGAKVNGISIFESSSVKPTDPAQS